MYSCFYPFVNISGNLQKVVNLQKSESQILIGSSKCLLNRTHNMTNRCDAHLMKE